MITAKEIKSNIFEMLMQVNDVKTLEVMREELECIYNKSYKEKEKPAFMEGVKPIRENVSLKTIMIEQGYKPCTYDEFRAVADQIDWGDLSLEEMLEDLKK